MITAYWLRASLMIASVQSTLWCASSLRMRRPLSSVPVAPMYLARRPNRAQATSAVVIWPPQLIVSRLMRIFEK